MFAAIHLPDFHLQAARRLRDGFEEKPVAMVSATDGKGLILEANSVATRQGIAPGMSTPQALARCAGLSLWECLPTQEGIAQSILLEVALSFSPLVEATREGLCLIDLRKCRTGNWTALGEEIVRRFQDLKLNAQVGFAPNPDLAWLAGRRASPVLVVQLPEVFLRELPVSSLEPPAALQELLQSWGIKTVGQLTNLPHAELTSRLGREASQLYERAASQTSRPLRLIQPVEEFVEAMEFECEIETVEPLLFVIRRMLDQLTRRLQGVHRVVARMTLTLPIENQTSHQQLFNIPSPTADPDVLFRILGTHLQSLQLEHRPVGLRLQMEPVRADHDQLRLFENPLRDLNRFGETIARLIALVGVENVGAAAVANTHRPDGFRLLEPRFHELKNESASATSPAIGLPLRRYRPPVSARINWAQDAPVYVFSEKANGLVVDALGPYHLASEWWDDQSWALEEWDVEIAGQGLYRLSRQQEEWKIEGCYDAALR